MPSASIPGGSFSSSRKPVPICENPPPASILTAGYPTACIIAPLDTVNVRDDGRIFVFDREYDEDGEEIPPDPIVWTDEYQAKQWKLFEPKPR